jgi:trehalose 6-phosphate phosphatase
MREPFTMTSSDVIPPGVVGGAGELGDRIRSAPGLLAGFDFDGTLAPIRVDPDAPQLSPEIERSLATLSTRRLVRVVVISGRALDDLAERIPIEGVDLAGNHGLELRLDGQRTVPEEVKQHHTTVRKAARTIRSKLSDIPSCRVENKGLTLSVHVRETPADRLTDVRRLVTDTVAGTPGLTLSEGKQVFEVSPNVPYDKGTAISQLASETPADWLALYLGDDTTDEDAFRAIQPGSVGIHVGSNTETAARYRLPDQSDVPAFLCWLVENLPVHDA